MMLYTTVALASVAFSPFASAQSLMDALNSIGASRFAQTIQANSTLLALYTSARTVYAIPDTSFVRLVRRQSSNAQAIQMHASNQITGLQALSTFPGAVSPVQLPAKDAQPNAVVSQSNLVLSQTNVSTRRVKRWGTVPTNPVSISSGLGNQVNLVRGDIPFDNGLIHIVDGTFTVPQSSSSTLTLTGLGSIQALLDQAGVSSTLANAVIMTFFMPSAAALTAYAVTNNLSPDALKTLILNHIVPNFSGYLPDLQNGMALPTMGGQTLFISVKNNAFFVNGVQIISANTILDNGAMHTVNQVLVPATNAPPSCSG
jgi:uncharacterized surface protein with fasciclin (FAS1) repeats